MSVKLPCSKTPQENMSDTDDDDIPSLKEIMGSKLNVKRRLVSNSGCSKSGINNNYEVTGLNIFCDKDPSSSCPKIAHQMHCNVSLLTRLCPQYHWMKYLMFSYIECFDGGFEPVSM